MRRLKNILCFLAAVILLGSCGKDASVLYLVVTPALEPEDGVCYANSGAQLRFNVEVFSLEGTVEKLSVSSFDEENGPVDHEDLVLGRKEYNGDYVCTVPVVQNEVRMNFLFCANDSAGNESRYNVSVTVRPSGLSQLTEHSGISLYPGNSGGKAEAFDLLSCQPVLLEPGVKADIVATSEDGTISLSTMTDVMFVRVNSFDYSSATFSGVSSMFMSAIRSTSVFGIAEDDVIIVGRSLSDEEEKEDGGGTAKAGSPRLVPLGVMKLIVVADGRIVFNYKS